MCEKTAVNAKARDKPIFIFREEQEPYSEHVQHPKDGNELLPTT
jgi:hypothetical protein